MDYSKGKIYLIRNRDNENLIYVGSTIEQYLSKRFCKHKYQTGCSLYQYINNPVNNTSWNDWYIELYEEYPCENKLQLCKRENEIIRERASINKNGYRTEEMKQQKRQEWNDNNKERIIERQKKYVEENREKVLARKAEYNEKTREYKNNYMRERYKEKKEMINEYKKEYREQNNEKINCDCGTCVLKLNMKKHLQSKKHIDYVAVSK